MKDYKITTKSDCWTNYFVKADSFEEAEEKFANSEYEIEDIFDYKNETIITVEEL